MRWALVTGATGTVGGVCADALAAAGFGVVVHGRRTDAVDAAVSRVRASGGSAVSLVGDLADPSGIAAAVTRLPHPPVVLVNAAAEFGPLATVAQLSWQDWRRLLALNLEGPLALIRALLPGMLAAGWGRIVQVSSAAAIAAPGGGNAGYSVSKAALDRALGHLAAEVAGSGVTVHSFHPGELASRMWEHIRAESGRPGFEGYADWAQATGESPDDPAAIAGFVTALLDDDEAARRHGTFSWAQDFGRGPVPLR